jgi:hypothetical protein
MPKLPTFTAKGEMTTATGSAQTNIQMGLNENLASAIAPKKHLILKIAIKQINF